jgi:two-component system LytT family response regulator
MIHLTNPPIKALIVDDEDLAREKIRFFLADVSDCLVIGECADGFQAVEAVCEELPDVIFLDIQMPEIDGFEVIRLIRDSLDDDTPMPLVVFTTAYDQYALRAFEANAADYLLKPFDYERFQAMFVRVQGQIRDRKARAAHDELLQQLSAYPTATSPQPVYQERFAFKTRGRIYFVHANDVDWIEADRNYALFHVGELTHILRATFAELEHLLNPADFLRIHRSAIIRKGCIEEITKRSDRLYSIVLKGGTTLDIGENYREDVFAVLGVS